MEQHTGVCSAGNGALESIHRAFAAGSLQLDDLTRTMRVNARLADQTGRIPDAFWQHAHACVLNQHLVPAAYGGSPQLESLCARATLMEHLAHADAALALALPGPGLAMPPVLALGSKPQQSNFFRHFQTDTPRWGAFAITEPGCGSDATAMLTHARRTARGWVLNGTKCFITNGARADVTVTFATLGSRRGRFGIRAFLVAAGTPGLEITRIERMAGLRASQLAVLTFSDCEVPQDAMLSRGDESPLDDAFRGAQHAWDYFRPLLASVMVGACRRVRDELATYLEEGGTPEDTRCNAARVRERLLDIDQRITAAHLLCQHTAWKADHGMATSMDACIAKAYASRVAAQITREAIVLVGLDGIASRPVLEQSCRDAKAFDIMEGTGELQRLMIARSAARERLLPWDSAAAADARATSALLFN